MLYTVQCTARSLFPFEYVQFSLTILSPLFICLFSQTHHSGVNHSLLVCMILTDWNQIPVSNTIYAYYHLFLDSNQTFVYRCRCLTRWTFSNEKHHLHLHLHYRLRMMIYVTYLVMRLRMINFGDDEWNIVFFRSWLSIWNHYQFLQYNAY